MPRPTDKIARHLVSVARLLNAALLRFAGRVTPTEQQRLLALTLVVGGVCGLVAVSFHLAITWVSQQVIEPAMSLPGWYWIPAAVVVPVVGALVVGVATVAVPQVRGSGIPQVKAVYSLNSARHRLRFRDAAAKFALSTLMIGTGASLGREGPTVQICATVANGIGRVFALSPSNQRRLIPVGAAAGIAAAFNAPIAAVTFVIEELVGALDTTVLSGVVVAAALAAVVEHSVLGEHPVFSVPHDYALTHPSSLLVYALLGVGAGLIAAGFTRGLLALRGWFSAASAIPAFAKPALGALVTASLAVGVAFFFHARGIAGSGYETIGLALGGELAVSVMLALFVAKTVATVAGYSSGGVGGIFAPTLFVGAMLGGLFGSLDALLLGHDGAQIGAFALVGMGAFFAGVIRAPITSILIIFEMTGSYRLVLPLMIANMAAYAVARRLARQPIYEALLLQDGIRLPHASTSGQTLSIWPIRAAMTRDLVTIDASASIASALDRITQTTFTSFPVVGADGTLQGVVTEGLLRRLEAEGHSESCVGEHARLREYLHTGQSLRDALSAMNRVGARQMVVVEEADRTRIAGILSMSDVMRAALVAESPASRSGAGVTPLPR